MPARLIKANVPQYESGYVHMPLDFINEDLTGKQQGFDTTMGALASMQLKQEVAPWDKGRDVELINKYNPQIEELTNQLISTGDVGQVAPRLSKVQQSWLNDPERKYLQTGFDWYTNIEKKRQQEEGYETAYNELLDPKTGGYKTSIDNYDLNKYAYIKSDSDKWLNDQLDNLKASTLERITNAGGKTWQDLNTGLMMYQEPGSTTTEVLDMNNPYIKNALGELTNSISEGQNDPAKWYKGKYSNPQDIADRVYQLATPRFYSKNTLQPGNQGFIPGQEDGGAGGKIYDPAVGFTYSPISADGYDKLSFDQMIKNKQSLWQANETLLGEGFDEGTRLAQEMGILPKLQAYVQNNKLDKQQSVDYLIKEIYNESKKYKDNPNITAKFQNLNSLYTDLVTNRTMLDIYNQIESNVYRQAFDKTGWYDKLDSQLKAVGIDPSKLSSSDKEDMLISLANAGKDQTGGTDFSIAQNILKNRGIELDGPGEAILRGLPELIKKDIKDNFQGGRVDFPIRQLAIIKEKETDTETERIIEPIKKDLETMSLDQIALTLGMTKGEELFDQALFKKGTWGKFNKGDVKFNDIRLVDYGPVPMALYSFKSSKEGADGEFSVLKPLYVEGASGKYQNIALEMYTKATNNPNSWGELADPAAKLYSQAILSPIDNLTIELMSRSKVGDTEYMTENIGPSGAIQLQRVNSGKNKNAFSVSIAGTDIQNVVVQDESEIKKLIGSTFLQMDLRRAGGGSSVGKQGQGISILQ